MHWITIMTAIALAAIPLTGASLSPSSRAYHSAATQTSDSIVHYTVGGTTAAQVRTQLNSKGPVGSDGKRHDASTNWNVSYRGTIRSVQGACQTVTLEVTTVIVMTMPLWVNAEMAPDPVATRWRDYYAALLLHEKGHAKLAQDATAALRWEFAKLPADLSCTDLRARRSATLARILEEYQAKQREYDVQTQNGKTQGAVFP